MDDRLTVKVDPSRALGKLKVLPEVQRRRLRVVIIRDTRKLAELVRNKLSGAVLKMRTGKLRASIRDQMVENSTSIFGRVFSSGVPYARIHEYGGVTRPHKITAVNARALHFFIGAQEFFRTSVNHPGSKIPQRSYLRSSLAEMRAEVLHDLAEAVRPNWRAL